VASRQRHVEVAHFLLELGAHPTVQDKDRRTPLHVSAEEGNMEVVRIPVEHDAHPAARAKGSGWTPLHAAVEQGNIEILRILIEHGEDPTAAADNGWTPLHVASSCGNVEAARFLIEHGADPTARADDGRTPLVVATEVGNVEAVRILVEHRTGTTIAQPTQNSRFVYYVLPVFFGFLVEIYLHFMHWH